MYYQIINADEEIVLVKGGGEVAHYWSFQAIFPFLASWQQRSTVGCTQHS